MGRGVDQLEHRRRRDAEEAELQEEAARLDASVDERAEDQLRVLDPVEEVLHTGVLLRLPRNRFRTKSQK